MDQAQSGVGDVMIAMKLSRRLGVLGVVLVALAGQDVRAIEHSDWEVLTIPAYRLSIGYPGNLFEPGEKADGHEGRVYRSRDGKAELLFAAGRNTTGRSLTDARDFALKEIYADAQVEYSPLRATWFVVSGTRGDRMFYDRTDFTCGGRLISTWSITYPVADRRFYDRIVEAIAKSWRPASAC